MTTRRTDTGRLEWDFPALAPFNIQYARDASPFYFQQIQRMNESRGAYQQHFDAIQAFAEAERQRQAALAAQQQQNSVLSGLFSNLSGGRGSSVGGGRTVNFGSAPAVGGNAALGKQIAAQYGITGRQWDALYRLGMNESGWRNTAQNPTSTAFGIGQFLNSTWATVGGHKTSDPGLQIQYMIKYIQNKYGNPINALNAWYSRSPHWY